MLAATGAEAGRARTVAERRRMLETLADHAEESPAEAVERRDLLAAGAAGPLRARLYTPGPDAEAGLVYFHGGGWVAGGLGTHDGVCRRLAAASGAKLLAVDYRLAPEHPFPAAVEDALAVTAWAAAQAQALGFDSQRLGVGGDSAGAGLAAVVAQSPSAPPLALQVLLCPILDLARESPSRREFAEGYFLDAATLAQDLSDYRGGHADLRDVRLSPLLAEDLAGQPPALVHAAEYDPFRDEAEAYARRLSEAGVPVRLTRWPGMIHYFYA
ncbi:MAG: alpha/beta hydrolase, partial [Phenylobacterium sp.]|nr:alpha/beta hydrolase [Phenylobacterium sp.]